YCPGSTCASGRSVRDVDHGGLAGTRDAHEVLVEGVAVLAGRKDSGARPRDGGVGIGTARELIGYESTPGKGGPPAFPGGRVGERVIERREVRQRESEHVRGPVEVEAAAVAAAGEVGDVPGRFLARADLRVGAVAPFLRNWREVGERGIGELQRTLHTQGMVGQLARFTPD